MSDCQDAHPPAAPPGLDLSSCEREPIHIPGSIQPHGAVLAALADGLLVTHASANLAAILGRPAESVLGRPLEQALDEAACRVLQHAGPHGGPALAQVYSLPRLDGGDLLLHSHRSGRHICVDIEPVRSKPGHGTPVAMAQATLDTFAHATSRRELCDFAVRGLKAATGYDRVMAYRFHEDGHGEVIAESRAAQLEPYLGLHYPASDIPSQARQLYLRQRVGAISDASYRPVPLLTDPGLDDGTPLDLTHSALRSVSPIHREYMRNMKTAASLTVGLVNRGELWGMLVCHHATPLVAEPVLRGVADMIGRVVSLLLGSLGETEAYAQRIARSATLRALFDRLAARLPLSDALAAAEAELLHLVDAAGVVVCLDGTVRCLGRTPPPQAAERALAVLRGACGGEVMAVDDLGLRHPDLADCTRNGSGALLLPLAPGGNDAILWFRPELRRTMVWGCNPAEHAIADPVTARLSPRTSFTAWKQTVAGRSAPWTRANLALAGELRNGFAAEVARRTSAELMQVLHYDALTGLPNRTLLQERLTEAECETGPVNTLLFLDLERTKEINETMGYAAGDALLVEVGRRLLRTAGPENFAARLSGDEFVVLCRGLDQDAIAELGERIRQAIAVPYEISGRSCHVTPSIGIVSLDQSGGLDLVGAANKAMYAAKVMIQAKRQAEDQRQKMEALGRMMGAVAHEVNNMLQPVTLLAQDVIDNGLVAAAGRQHLDIVLECSKKARHIIGDLLAFSRTARRSVEVHDLSALLDESLRIVRQAIPSAMTLSVRVEGHPPPVTIDRTVFTQILLNLATNGAAAMAGRGELKIWLNEAAHASGDGVARQTRAACLRVIDTGCGMTKATLDRAFEPFFTTKPVGQGTGLGLPVVYGLVREMGGTIGLDSEPGAGTTVTIVIPGHHGGADNGSDIGD